MHYIVGIGDSFVLIYFFFLLIILVAFIMRRSDFLVLAI
jgi:hypothetical protein